jgi:hypothetical protein
VATTWARGKQLTLSICFVLALIALKILTKKLYTIEGGTEK